jgi:hypothetical protein
MEVVKDRLLNKIDNRKCNSVSHSQSEKRGIERLNLRGDDRNPIKLLTNWIYNVLNGHRSEYLTEYSSMMVIDLINFSREMFYHLER